MPISLAIGIPLAVLLVEKAGLAKTYLAALVCFMGALLISANATNLDMFGFKMPDNFDLPDDFFSEIRSSEKSRPEPNETVNDDPTVKFLYSTVG